MGRDTKGRGERNLLSLDLEYRVLPLTIQGPDPLHRADGIDTGFVNAIQLPCGTLELHVDAGWHTVGKSVIFRPDPRMHPALGASQEQPVRRPVQMLR